LISLRVSNNAMLTAQKPTQDTFYFWKTFASVKTCPTQDEIYKGDKSRGKQILHHLIYLDLLSRCFAVRSCLCELFNLSNSVM